MMGPSIARSSRSLCADAQISSASTRSASDASVGRDRLRGRITSERGTARDLDLDVGAQTATVRKTRARVDDPDSLPALHVVVKWSTLRATRADAPSSKRRIARFPWSRPDIAATLQGDGLEGPHCTLGMQEQADPNPRTPPVRQVVEAPTRHPTSSNNSLAA